MTFSNTVQLDYSPISLSKLLNTVKDFFGVLAESFVEAKAMEQKSRKTSGNW